MSIIGCDLHTLYQVIAMLEKQAGEIVTRRLEHASGETKTFYAGLPKRSLIGIEASATAVLATLAILWRPRKSQ
jgi:hypothetical protein